MEDEEWEDVLVVSFVYPVDSDVGPQNKGTLSGFKRRLKVSYQPLEFGDPEHKVYIKECFRTPSNHLVMMINSAPGLRVFDPQLKPVLLDMLPSGRFGSWNEFLMGHDFKTVGIFDGYHYVVKHTLAIYNMELNSVRDCIEISQETFEIRQSKKKLRPFKILKIHMFTSDDAFLFSDSMDYIRIDLATGEPTYLFNLIDIDQQSGGHLYHWVPNRKPEPTLMKTPNGKSYVVSAASKHYHLMGAESSFVSHIFLNEIVFAGNQTKISRTKCYRYDGHLRQFAILKEGLLVLDENSPQQLQLSLVRPNPSLSQAASDLTPLKALQVFEDTDPCQSSCGMILNIQTLRLGRHNFGIFGWGRYKQTTENQLCLYLKVWVLSQGQFHTHKLPIHNFERCWKVLQLGPDTRQLENGSKKKRVQFMITLEGTGKDNKGKKVALLTTFELRN